MLECAYGKAEQDNADICIFESDLYDVVTKNGTYCDWSFKREFFPKSMPFAPNDGGNTGKYISNVYWMGLG